jgi:hypothetical protein
MAVPSTYRRTPRGRPLIGFQLEAPREVELREGPVLRCCEVRQDGKTIGELEVSVFAAALIIDRDGILAQKARDVVEREVPVARGAVAVAVRLPGASGYRADAFHDAPLPYVQVFAVAPSDLGVDGGVLVTVRSVRPDWAAAEHILRTLRILTRHGVAAANDDAEAAQILPVVVPRRG